MTSHSRSISFEGVDNVRDLGGLPTSDGRVIIPGLIFRGAALHSITDSDARVLSEQLHISTIVDLRCGYEREAKPNRQVPGAEQVWIPLFDEDEVGIDYFKPVEGTHAIGNDFACDQIDFYRALANPLTAGQMKKALHTIFNQASQGKPVYYHCSGGKDRAGTISLLVLSVLGVDRKHILDDYLLTNASRDKALNSVFERFLRLSDGNEELAHELTMLHRARKEHLQAFEEAVIENYGSIDTFMRDQLGITDNLCAEWRASCTMLLHELENTRVTYRPAARARVAAL